MRFKSLFTKSDEEKVEPVEKRRIKVSKSTKESVQVHQLQMALFLLSEEFNHFREERGFARYDYVEAVYRAVGFQPEPSGELVEWMTTWRRLQAVIKT